MPKASALLLNDLAFAWPDRPVPPQTLALYARELSDVPDDVLTAVVRELIRTEQFFPRLATILAACAEYVLHLPSEAEALDQIEARIAWGHNGRVPPSPAVAALVAAALDKVGGYAAWRTAEKPHLLRSQFLSIYRAMRAAETKRLAVGGFRKEITPGGLQANAPQQQTFVR